MMETVIAIFAGGCFWCMQPVFDSEEGVISTSVGYTGGHYANPTYEDLHNKTTGHYEAIEVKYDPKKVTYEDLLKIYFANIDPFDTEGQFADKGHEYKTVVFYSNNIQKAAAEKYKAELEKSFKGRKIATLILPAKTFYAAEDYHQKYYEKNPLKYNAYKYGSGRANGVRKIWGN